MPKGNIELSENVTNQAAWRFSWRSLILFGVAACLVVLMLIYWWNYYTGFVWVELFVLFTAQALLTLILAIAMERVPLQGRWSYRLAFLGSAGVFSFFWLVSLVIPSYTFGLFWLLTAIGGAFIGGLFATSRREQLWENNSPPPAWRHQQR